MADSNEDKDAIELDKLRAERDLALYQISWRARTLEAFKSLTGGTAALAVAIGLWISSDQWNQKQLVEQASVEDARRSERRTRDNATLEAALADLASGVPEKIPGATATLVPIFDCTSPKLHHRALLTAARTLVLLDQQAPRETIIQFIEQGAKSSLVEDRTKLAALDTMLEESRTLVHEHNLWSELPRTNQPTAQVLKARSVGRAIEQLARSGIVLRDLDFSDVYCSGCDFSGLDMSGSRFERAILHHATFENGTLVGCNFDGAYLDFTHFISADLRFSSFAEADEGRFRDTEHTEYEEVLVRRVQEYATAHPDDVTFEHLDIARAVTNLTCADLRDARISMRVFAMTPGAQRSLFRPLGFVFSGADLRGADMSDMIIWGVKANDSPFPFGTGVHFTTQLSNDMVAYSIHYLDGAWKKDDRLVDISEYEEDVGFIQFCMMGSSWDQAILPASFAEILSRDDAAVAKAIDDLTGIVDCRPRSPDLPFGATLAVQHAVREKWKQMRGRDGIEVILPAALSSLMLESLTALSLNSKTVHWHGLSLESTGEEPPECLLEL